MPGARKRERGRRAALHAILDRIAQAPTFAARVAAVEEVGLFLRRVAASDRKVWPYLKVIEARYPDDKYGDEERTVTRAMIADVVNPYLAASSSRAAARRRDLAS